MNIFLGILAVVLLLLLWDEKDQSKRTDFRYSFIAVIAGMVAVTILKLIF